MFLSKYLPNASVKKTDSTAAAAEALVKCPNATKSAAICSKVCISMFKGLQLLQEGIQDEQSMLAIFMSNMHISNYCCSQFYTLLYYRQGSLYKTSASFIANYSCVTTLSTSKDWHC